MKISIAVPTYECFGNGWLYISELLNSIKKQTYTNFEIIISDQSSDDKTKKIIDFYKEELDIKYYNSSHIPRNISLNFNNAIEKCSGDIIKTMCADDFFIDNKALEKIKRMFNDNNVEWLVNGSYHCQNIHFLTQPMTPFYNEKIHLGANTISSPSVLTIRKKEYFDENLSFLADCEMYKKLYNKYGQPAILSEQLICNRMHQNQMQKFDEKNDTLKTREIEYCKKLYGN